MLTSTIAAISTGLTNSGISIIRISGNKSLDIAKKIFDSYKKLEPNKIVYGNIVKNDIIVDNVLVSYFKAPKSFTGEDIIEINCHGGVQITKEILEYVLQNGAVLAGPGEFSRRAFLNGKIDLSKAEAVIDLINAKTRVGTKIFEKQLQGELAVKVTKLREELIEMLAHISVSIDYPEYDYEEVKNENVVTLLNKKIKEISNLLKTYEQGKVIKNGVNVAIIGRPNVGKSSILNRLSKSNKAIVTDIAGTTRDIVEESVNIGNLVLNLSDTAGIRDTDDLIEKMGVEKSIKILDEVDLVLYVLNAEDKIQKEDYEILSKIKNKELKYIVVINKIDKIDKTSQNQILTQIKGLEVENLIMVSACENYGMDELKSKIEEMFNTNDLDYQNELIITNERHKMLLEMAVNNLNNAINTINLGMPIDIISIYIKNATKFLGQIIGQDVNLEVTKKIFEKFCIGK